MLLKKNDEANTELSIVDLIVGSIDENGSLPQGFRLPESGDTGLIRYAPGAMDGICLYHMRRNPLVASDRQKLEEILKLAGNGETAEAEMRFAEFCKEHRAITIIDELQEYIFEHRDELKSDVMYKFASDMFLHTTDIECVKIGLSILEMFITYENEEIKNAVKAVGLSDEFTLFSLYLMRRWPTSEEDVLECAKHVRGWGRIHCVDYINCNEEETREWLLYNGIDNDVLASYSAYAVYAKAGVSDRVKRGNLKYEEMHAILKITKALIDDGPIRGINIIDEPKAYLSVLLKRTEENYPFTEEDMEITRKIRDYLASEQG